MRVDSTRTATIRRVQPTHENTEANGTVTEGRGAFGGFIGPRTLVGLVKSAAPYLFDGTHPLAAQLLPRTGARLHELAFHPLGWWSCLLADELLEASKTPTPEQRTDYFALCLAAHFASAATYVPTDVDTKIRHALWFEEMPSAERDRMRALALTLAQWDIRAVSARITDVDGVGLVSGHDGERLSVLSGGLLAHLAAGDTSGAAELEQAIDDELAREARAFDVLARARGREVDLLNVAAILTHNAGDILQALDAKGGRPFAAAARVRFGDLARENGKRYGGAFVRAGTIYRELLASEGHRHYPLRQVKLLREHPDLLLPLGPFLDGWGARLARWPTWSPAQRAEVVAGIVEGTRKVAGQEGYYRALAGFDRTYPGGIDARDLATHYTTSTRRELKDPTLRKKVELERGAFEARYAKRARTILSSSR